MENTDHAHDPKTCDDVADDELPPMEDIIYPPLRKEILAEGRTPQYSEEWTLNTNGSHCSLPQPILADSVDDSQGTRGMPASHHRYKQSPNDTQIVRSSSKMTNHTVLRQTPKPPPVQPPSKLFHLVAKHGGILRTRAGLMMTSVHFPR